MKKLITIILTALALTNSASALTPDWTANWYATPDNLYAGVVVNSQGYKDTDKIWIRWCEPTGKSGESFAPANTKTLVENPTTCKTVSVRPVDKDGKLLTPLKDKSPAVTYITNKMLKSSITCEKLTVFANSFSSLNWTAEITVNDKIVDTQTSNVYIKKDYDIKANDKISIKWFTKEINKTWTEEFANDKCPVVEEPKPETPTTPEKPVETPVEKPEPTKPVENPTKTETPVIEPVKQSNSEVKAILPPLTGNKPARNLYWYDYILELTGVLFIFMCILVGYDEHKKRKNN